MTTTKKGAKSAKLEKAMNAVKAGQVVRAAELQTAGEVVAQVVEDAKKAMTAKQQAAQEKREWLRGISAEFQAQREIMEMTGADYIPTINEMLRAYYAKQANITELNTFDQWKEKGYQVRRGEKAFLFWGKPKRNKASRRSRLNRSPQRQMSFTPFVIFLTSANATRRKHNKQAKQGSGAIRPCKAQTNKSITS